MINQNTPKRTMRVWPRWIAFCLVLLPATSQAANWVTHGPELGIGPLVIDPANPKILYAGTHGAWADPKKGGVLKSTNGGESWHHADSEGTSPYGITALAIHPVAPATVYAGTRSGGVFKSTQGGKNWTAANNGLQNLFVNDLVIDPGPAHTLYAATDGGVFQSPDAISWGSLNTGLTELEVHTLAIDATTTPRTLYAGTYHGGVFKSTNGGGNWTASNHGLTEQCMFRIEVLKIDPTNPGILYVGCWGGPFKSTNGGGTWGPLNHGLPVGSIASLEIDPKTPTTFYAGSDTGNGVFRSTNGGETWSSSGLDGHWVTDLAIAATTPTTVYASSLSGQGVYRLVKTPPFLGTPGSRPPAH